MTFSIDTINPISAKDINEWIEWIERDTKKYGLNKKSDVSEFTKSQKIENPPFWENKKEYVRWLRLKSYKYAPEMKIDDWEKILDFINQHKKEMEKTFRYYSTKAFHFLPRTIVSLETGEIFVRLNKVKYRDWRDEGTFRICKTAVEVVRGNIMAYKTTKYDENFKEKISQTIHEVKIFAALAHSSYITHVYGAFILEGKKYHTILDFCLHGTLLCAIQEARLSNKDKIKVAYELIIALQEMHEAGVLHRDISLKNIFLDENNTPKFGDCHLSCFKTDALGAHIGTNGYFAPEHLVSRATANISEAQDIWALGCVLYELIYGINCLPWAFYNEQQTHAYFKNLRNDESLFKSMKLNNSDLDPIIVGFLHLNPQKRIPLKPALKILKT